MVLVPQIGLPGQVILPARLAVTGQAPGPGGQLEMVTMLLNPETGLRHTSWPADIANPDTLGLRRYVGIAGGPSTGRDVDWDFHGNIYVVGPSAGLDANGQATGLDYVCVKITPSGHWSNTWPATATQPEAGVRRYNGPGNGDDVAQQVLTPKKDFGVANLNYWIYVGGTSWGGESTKNDVAILQIHKDSGEFGIGVENPLNPGWGGPYRYHRPSGFNDVFAEMMEGGGSLLVALTSEAEWVGGGGGAMLMGDPGAPEPVPTHRDYTTLRLNQSLLTPNSPILVWDRHYNGLGNLDDVAYGITYGLAGGGERVFTVGSAQAFGGARLIKVVRYNFSNGDLDGWQEQHGRYHGGYGHDDGFDVALGENNDRLYVVGASTRSHGGRDQVILKYNPSTGMLASGWPAFYGATGLNNAATLVRPQSGNLGLFPRFVVGGWVSVPGQDSNISIVQWQDVE